MTEDRARLRRTVRPSVATPPGGEPVPRGGGDASPPVAVSGDVDAVEAPAWSSPEAPWPDPASLARPGPGMPWQEPIGRAWPLPVVRGGGGGAPAPAPAVVALPPARSVSWLPAVVLGLGVLALVGSIGAVGVAWTGLRHADRPDEAASVDPAPAPVDPPPPAAPPPPETPPPVAPAATPPATPSAASSSSPSGPALRPVRRATSPRPARTVATPAPPPPAGTPRGGASLVAAKGFGGAVVKTSCADGGRAEHRLAAGATVAVPAGCKARVTCLGAQATVDEPGRYVATGCTTEDPSPHLGR